MENKKKKNAKSDSSAGGRNPKKNPNFKRNKSETISARIKPQKHQNRFSLLGLKKIGLIAGLVAFFLILFGAIYSISFIGRIYPKTYVGNINLGGKKPDEAKKLIQSRIEELSQNRLNLIYNDQNWQIEPNDINMLYDLDASVNLAMSTGRKGGFKKAGSEWLKSIFLKNRSSIYYTYNEEKMNQFLAKIAAKIDLPKQETTIVIKDLKPEVKAGNAGTVVDQAKAKKEILENLAFWGNKEVKLAVIESPVEISFENAQAVKAQTEKILSERITINTNKQDLHLEVKEMASWLEFAAENHPENIVNKPVLVVKVNQESLKKYAKWLAGQVDQKAQEPKFNYTDGQLAQIQQSQTGYELDQEKTVQILNDSILNGTKTINLPINVSKPQFTSGDISNLGIKELVGEATTNFWGSPSNRRHNIATGAKALHGVLVAPGAEFSTVGNLGEVDAAHGYLSELVIKGDRTTPEFGGGLCQVSTTLFRAVMNTGLKVSERRNHSYRVSYYEPPVGMDATIYVPAPDFKFVNNMDHYILIQSEVVDSSITFRIYGTKDGRRADISKPVVYNITEPEPPLYAESPTLEKGEIKKLESAHNGASASFTYKVFNSAGKQIIDQKFTSVYVPWRARYLYGPGTTIPQE